MRFSLLPLLSFALAAPPAVAYQLQQAADASPVQWRWADFPLSVRIAPPLAGIRARFPFDPIPAVRGAVQQWQSIPTSGAALRYAGPAPATITRAPLPGEVLITFDGAQFPGGPDVSGLTELTVSTADVHVITAAHIHLNARDYVWATNGATDALDVWSVALHELGHALGIAHPCGDVNTDQPSCTALTPAVLEVLRTAVMWPTLTEGPHRAFSADDVLAAAAAVPVVVDTPPLIDSAAPQLLSFGPTCLASLEGQKLTLTLALSIEPRSAPTHLSVALDGVMLADAPLHLSETGEVTVDFPMVTTLPESVPTPTRLDLLLVSDKTRKAGETIAALQLGGECSTAGGCSTTGPQGLWALLALIPFTRRRSSLHSSLRNAPGRSGVPGHAQPSPTGGSSIPQERGSGSRRPPPGEFRSPQQLTVHLPLVPRRGRGLSEPGGGRRARSRAEAISRCFPQATLFSLLLALLVCPTPAHAYKRSVVKGTDLCTFWATRGHSFMIDAKGTPDVPPAQAFDAIRKSFQTWSSISCSNLAFPDLGISEDPADRRTGFVAGAFNRNLILFRTVNCATGVVPSGDACLTEGGCANKYDCWDSSRSSAGSIIATTTTTSNRYTGQIADSDIEMNDAPDQDGLKFTFTANDGPPCFDTNQTNCVRYDIRNTVTHEAGHTIGLDHTTDETATMYATAPEGETAKRNLHPDDTQAICDIYPLGAPVKTCLGDPLTVTQTGGSNGGGCGCATYSNNAAGLQALAFLSFGLVVLRRRRAI